jgi:hypothetical protein
MENVFKSKLEAALKDYSRDNLVIYDPSGEFNDSGERYFLIKNAFVNENKGIIEVEGIEYNFLLMDGEAIPLILVPGDYKKGISSSKIMSFSSYFERVKKFK